MLLAIEPIHRHTSIPKNLNGIDGLYLAVIHQAHKDALSQSQSLQRVKMDALEYFCSDDYEQHLRIVGLPGDALPAGIERVD